MGQLPGNEAQESPRVVHLKGMAGSAPAFFAAAAFHKLSGIQLFILNDIEEAAYFFNDLENLLEDQNNPYHKKKVLFFPTSYKRAHEPQNTDNTNLLARSQVLKRISSRGKNTFVVTCPQALAEKVVNKKQVKKNTFRLQQDEEVGIDFLNDLLHEYGFVQTDFVVEPGQFSVRGGIIDVFSFTNDKPYRIEFFGDEVESIRTFNPQDQLSLDQLSHITIVPNVQDRQNVTDRQSFLEYLPTDSMLWFAHREFALEKIQEERDKLEQALEKDDQNSAHNLFVSYDDFLDQAKGFHQLIFREDSASVPRVGQTLSFDQAPQMAFNKSFSLLKEALIENTVRGYTNYIFTDSSQQIRRLQSILDDMDAEEEALPRPGEKALFVPVMTAVHQGFTDNDLRIACFTDHQIFERYHKFRLKTGYTRSDSVSLTELYRLEPGDFVSHIDHGVGVFDGLQKIVNNGKEQEAVRLLYKNGDLLYVSIHSLHRIARYVGKEGKEPKVDKLGGSAWKKLKSRTKSRVKDIAADLIRLYAKRKATKGYAFSPDSYLQHELEASFIYEDTPDQLAATQAVKEDMEAGFPMDRLICGDVGFGKTEVAIRAAFKAVADGKQVAVLVPTTILAVQHYKSFSQRLEEMPVKVGYINRFKSQTKQKETLNQLKSGQLDIIIGTHRIVSKDVKFSDLGLLVIDEEQKFGVSVKEKLRQLRANVDTLTLTATPIPRTLQFSLMGARDLSVINTPPANRFPVQTEIHGYNEKLIGEAIEFEVGRGGQVFFLHNRVQNIKEVAAMVQNAAPGVRVVVGHGQLEGRVLEKTMVDFIEKKYDVLVATTIIESGLDIPNANTIIINDAQKYGLSDLHQLRGRVGRSNKKAFCYLLAPPMAAISDDARKRLKALEDFSALGSGFSIAMRDLDIRGAGDILGAEQSGFITEMGYEMYQKVINEAVNELKNNEFKDLFPKDKMEETSEKSASKCAIESDLQLLIPDTYVSSSAQRLYLYKQLDESHSEEEIESLRKEFTDRFGAMPHEVKELFYTKKLRKVAVNLGFEKIILKGGKLLGHFISNNEDQYYQSRQFMQIIEYATKNPRKCRLKEKNNKRIFLVDDVKSVDQAAKVLSAI